jgi:hypothetical protein
MYFIVSVHEEVVLTVLYNILQHPVAWHLLPSSLMCQQAAQEQWPIKNEYFIVLVYMGLQE